MNLNDIVLNPYMLTELYPDVLIQSQNKNIEIEPDLKYLGQNAKRIALLINNPSVPFLTDSEFSFLTSILTACKLSLADVALLNIYKTEPDAILVQLNKLNSDKVIMLGVDPLSTGLPINFPQFQLQLFDKRTYLYAPTLEDLEKDKTLKQRLWTCLKTMFEL